MAACFQGEARDSIRLFAGIVIQRLQQITAALARLRGLLAATGKKLSQLLQQQLEGAPDFRQQPDHQQTEQGQQLSLEPKITQNILASLNERIEEATNLGEKMVVLCSPVVRYHFKRLTEKFIPNLIVISHNELSSEANIRSLGTVRL